MASFRDGTILEEDERVVGPVLQEHKSRLRPCCNMCTENKHAARKSRVMRMKGLAGSSTPHEKSYPSLTWAPGP